MKLNKKNNLNKFNKWTILLFAIMFIGLGFAAISATLGINSHAIIGNISFDVHFENVEVKEGSMKAKSPATIVAPGNTQINFSLHLTTPGEYYEFETDVVNSGTLDAYLSSIELLGLDEKTQKYLNVTYKYIGGGKLKINDLLKSGETERIKVRVNFLYDITLDDLPPEEKSLDFTLNLTYTQDNGTGVERDKDAIDVNILGQDMISYMDNVASKYVTSATGINFGLEPSDTNGKGLYLRAGTEEDRYPIYYFRGGDDLNSDGVEDTLNNHVLFGGYCWKIVRTTEQGGTKIIYDGEPDASNQCNNTGTASQIGKSAFNTNTNELADIGYMYGERYAYTSWEDTEYVYGSDVTYSGGVYTLTQPSESNTIANIKTKHYTCKKTTNETCSTVYYVYSYYKPYDKTIYTAYAIALENGEKLEDIISKSYANENDSTIKTAIDNWFKDNLASQKGKLEDAVWCNDRSITSGGYLADSDLTLNGGETYLGGYTRTYTTRIPGLKDEEACPNKNDRFTVSDTKTGNGVLTYPVGLITIDELTGAGYNLGPSNINYYLQTGQSYWTLSLSTVASYGYTSYGFRMESSGYMTNGGMSLTNGVRPSIVLKKGIVATSGDGSSEHPYVVE